MGVNTYAVPAVVVGVGLFIFWLGCEALDQFHFYGNSQDQGTANIGFVVGGGMIVLGGLLALLIKAFHG